MVIVDAPMAGGGLVVRREEEAAARPATRLMRRTVKVQVAQVQEQPWPTTESTQAGHPPGGSGDTSRGTVLVDCKGERVGLPPPLLPSDRRQMQMKVVLALRPLCSPYPLETIF